MSCKGSWVNSAQNIVYNGNILECELKSINGDWIYNELNFLPHYEYCNIDGKFEWHNCNNNVELHNTSHEHISRRYKQISIQQCLENITSEYDDWFEIEKEYINNIKDKCLSITLFKKNSYNTYNNEFNVDETQWINKYYNSLINNLNNYKYNDICINLYLANNLRDYITVFSKYTFLNIFLMKSESIGASPGTLWRYIDISNKSYKNVYIADIDENWDWIYSCNINEEYRNYKLCTLIPWDITISSKSPAYNFPTIMGGHTMVNPNKFDYNIVDVMKGFISLCKNKEKSNPYSFDDNDPITFWNHPLFGNSWGRITTKYGFDEFFLKHVIYYDVYPDMKFI